MGWITGAWRPKPDTRQELTGRHASAVCIADTDQLIIYGNGLPETFFHGVLEKENSGWAVTGIGISRGDDPQLMTQSDWQHLFHGDGNQSHPHTLNGHFAAIRWDDHGIDFFTDTFGLKNLYYHKAGKSVLFSTRLDTLLPLTSGCDIDWHSFGSRWVGTHGYGTGSFIKGIDRLSQGGSAWIETETGSFQLNHNRWTPSQNESSPEQLNKLLSSFTTLPMSAGKKLSLGLSGGFDSRVLLAHLINQPNNNWQTHTFGAADQPDRQLADALARLTDTPHYPLPEPALSSEQIIDQLPSFVGQTLFTSLPHTMIRLTPYRKLREMGVFVIDGAFGEIARRRLAQRIYLQKSRALRNENFEQLLPLFAFQRADIFKSEINETLHKGFQEELFTEFERMPSVRKMGPENWLDLFSIRTQAPNAGGPEQSRSDAILPNYMAYLQPQFVDAVLNLPLKYRKNGVLLRNYLRKHNPELCGIPLVKGVRSYPFWMKDKPAAIWTRLKYMFKEPYRGTAEIDMSRQLETYIRDKAASTSVQSYGPYNIRKIEELIHLTFEESNTNAAHQLNWWLTFDTFRELLNK